MKLTTEEIEKRKANLEKLEASVKILADMGAGSGEGEDEGEDKIEELEDKCENLLYGLRYALEEIQYLTRLVAYCEEELYKHESNGHLPSVKSAEQMKRAVSALGLDDEYDVQKRTIYASTNGSVAKMVIG